jgi:hypothetical protein
MCGSLQSLREVKEYRAGHMSVFLSVRMIQHANYWTDLDEIWYEIYAIGVYPKLSF